MRNEGGEETTRNNVCNLIFITSNPMPFVFVPWFDSVYTFLYDIETKHFHVRVHFPVKFQYIKSTMSYVHDTGNFFTVTS